MDSLDLFGAGSSAVIIMTTGVSQQELPRLLEVLRVRAGADWDAAPWPALLLANLGRPGEARATLQDAPQSTRDMARVAVAWVHGIGDGPDVAKLARELATKDAPFMAGEYCIAHRDAACVRDAAAAIDARLPALEAKADSAPDMSDAVESATITAALLDAGLDIVTNDPGAASALTHADSLLMHTSLSVEAVAGMGPLLSLASTRAHVAMGDVAGAYAAAKRGAAISLDMMASGPLLLEYARAAARLDKREEAIDAYRRFLELRQQPEPGLPTVMVQQARRELERLTSEPRR